MILHIINSYSSTELYRNLIKEIDIIGYSQVIYNPLRNSNNIGNHEVKFVSKESKIVYSPVLNNHLDRILYRFKIRKIMRDIEDRVDLSKIRVIHAHTWYSDGGVAYLLSKKYNIPFIVVVRNTDINYFQKYLIHERSFGKKILKESSKIILISASYKRKILEQHNLQSILPYISSKLEIIPNGVDKFWLKNIYPKKKDLSNPVNIIYIGRFTGGKNVLNLQRATLLLNENGISCKLHLVGGGGGNHRKILNIVSKYCDIFVYHGKISDKRDLSTLLRGCDIFAMPSKNETFGLVYMEALLQGLPILFTKNEGIDGFYGDRIGEGVDNTSFQEIAGKLCRIIDKYDDYEFDQNVFVENHDWKNIAWHYNELYFSLISNTPN